eukprot:TRINITY_DN24377_c0_g1_i1.p3 TRINITY_DN24377_c0_g1~~TRINITY_DN24377_c0_g1_i1.p3  ORF type:complete len:173 (-),score=23.77 TRINITY_DN24377_c0_g1_i1:110-628(-)
MQKQTKGKQKVTCKISNTYLLKVKKKVIFVFFFVQMGRSHHLDLEDRAKHPSIEEEAKQIWKEASLPKFRTIRLKEAEAESRNQFSKNNENDIQNKIKKKVESDSLRDKLSISDDIKQALEGKLSQRKLIWSSNWGWSYDVWPEGMDVVPSHHKRFSLFWHASQFLNNFNKS